MFVVITTTQHKTHYIILYYEVPTIKLTIDTLYWYRYPPTWWVQEYG